MEAKAKLVTYEVLLTGNPSKIMTKDNGKNFVLFNAEITSEKGKGLPITAQFTFGENKTMPAKGDNVTVVYTVVPSDTRPGEFQPFFEVRIGKQAASASEIIAALGMPENVEEQIL